MNEKEKEVSTAQERTRDDHISDIVFEDIKTITKCIQNMIKMIEESGHAYVRTKIMNAIYGLYKDALVPAVEATQYNISFAPKYLIADKIKCVVLDLDEECQYAILVATIPGLVLPEGIMLISKENLKSLGISK